MPASGVPDPTENVRASYDAVAEPYREQFADELDRKPLDRALLRAVVELAANRPIADLGCGPGHVSQWLSANGARVVGIDLSPAMVEAARGAVVDAEFRVGDLRELPAQDGEFGAAVVFYSIIHVADADRPLAWRELARVLAGGGTALVAFHVGDEVRHRDEWFGQPVNLDFRLLEPAVVTQELESAGFAVRATLTRAHEPGEVETVRAYVLAVAP